MSRARPGSADPLSFSRFLTFSRVSTARLARLLGGAALLGVAAIVVSAVLAPGGSATDTGRVARLLPVATAVGEPADGYVRRREYTGEVRAGRQSALGFDRAGRVVAIQVDEGSVVEAGGILAVLDTRRLAAERECLVASRVEAGAMLTEMRAGPRKEVIAVAEEVVAELRARVALGERMRDRRRQLLDDRCISDEEYDEVATRLDSMGAQLRGAEDRLTELREGTRAERIDAQEARGAQLEAQITRIDVEVDDSTLRAPFAGRILRRHVDEGTVVAPGQAVLTLVEDSVLEAWVGVPPRIGLGLSPSSEHVIRVGDAHFDGRVVACLPATDPITRTQTVVLALAADTAGCVVPGQVARLDLEEWVPGPGLWIPASALTRGVRGLWAVYAVEAKGTDGFVVVRHAVEVLHAEEGRVFVRGTPTPETRFVVGNTERIAPGQSVAPKPMDA